MLNTNYYVYELFCLFCLFFVHVSACKFWRRDKNDANKKFSQRRIKQERIKSRLSWMFT